MLPTVIDDRSQGTANADDACNGMLDGWPLSSTQERYDCNVCCSSCVNDVYRDEGFVARTALCATQFRITIEVKDESDSEALPLLDL